MISISASDPLGGGGWQKLFPVVAGQHPIKLPELRDVFFYIYGRPGEHPPFLQTHGNSGGLDRSAYTFNINSLLKKTFTKSLGGHGPRGSFPLFCIGDVPAEI